MTPSFAQVLHIHVLQTELASLDICVHERLHLAPFSCCMPLSPGAIPDHQAHSPWTATDKLQSIM